MAVTISIALQKGGTSKTTTSLNLADCLGYRHKKVLLIDLDSQANATFTSGQDSKNLGNSVYNVLTPDNRYKCTAEEAVIHCKYYDLIPADIDVKDLVVELNDVFALKKAIQPLQSRYDYIVIDTPPAITSITINALCCSDHIILPCEPRPYSFLGLSDLLDAINQIKENHWNGNLNVLGILLVKYNKRTRLTRNMREMIEKYADRMDTTIFSTSIRECIAVPESQVARVPLLDYSPRCTAVIDYQEFTSQVIKRLGEGKNGKKRERFTKRHE